MPLPFYYFIHAPPFRGRSHALFYSLTFFFVAQFGTHPKGLTQHSQTERERHTAQIQIIRHKFKKHKKKPKKKRVMKSFDEKKTEFDLRRRFYVEENELKKKGICGGIK